MSLNSCGAYKNFSPYLLDSIKENKNNEHVVRSLVIKPLIQVIPSQSQSITDSLSRKNLHQSKPIYRLRDSSGTTLLHYAAEYGNSNIVKCLIALKCQIDVQNNAGKTPLMLAVMNNQKSVVEILLKANAKIHVVDFQGQTALYMILQVKEMTEILLKNMTFKMIEGISPTILTEYLLKNSFTLYRAVHFRNFQLVKFLLEQIYPLMIDEKDTKSNETALHKAVKDGSSDIVKILVEHSANVNALDSIKATPIYYSYTNNENANDYLEILKVLVNYSTSLTTSNDNLRMQIYPVLVNGCKEAVQLVLLWVNNLNVSDNLGNTVLHYLARNKNTDVMEALQGRHFNINKRNKDSYTPLHLAAFAVSMPALKFLLENNADVHARGHSYETPLHRLFLRLQSDPEHSDAKNCIEILLEYGSDAEDFDVLGNFNWISKCYAERIIDRGEDDANSILTLVEPLLKYLAIRKVLNGGEIDEFTMLKINLKASWVKYFDETCKRESECMNNTVIYGNVTLFAFLTESIRKISTYVRNDELVLELQKFISRLNINSPYSFILQSRLAKAIHFAKLKENAITIVYLFVNCEDNAFYSIAEYIVDYLSIEDMKNLYFACDTKQSC